MARKKQKQQKFEIRSVSYVCDPDSNMEWFNIWVSIAKKLNKDYSHIRTWTKQGVQNIIKNPKYAGYYRYGKRANHSDFKDKELIEKESGYITAIISKETWNRCQEILEKRHGKDRIDPKFLNTSFLFRDVLLCGLCYNHPPLSTDDQRTKQNTYGKRWYVCKSCKKIKIYADDLENILKKRIRNQLLFDGMDSLIKAIQKSLKEENDNLYKKDKRADKDILKYESKVSEIERLIDKYNRLIHTDENQALIEILTLSRASLSLKIENLKKHKLENANTRFNNSKLETNDEHWASRLRSLEKEQSCLTGTEWRQLITRIVKSVIISPNKAIPDLYELSIEFNYNNTDLTLTFDPVDSSITTVSQLSLHDAVQYE